MRNKSRGEFKLVYKLIPILFLFYLSSPIYQLFQEPLHERIIGLILLTLFIFCYLHGFWHERFRAPFTWIMIGITGYLSLVVNPFCLMLGFFTSPLIGFTKNPRNFWISMGATGLLFIAVMLNSSSHMDNSELLNMLPPMLVILFVPPFVRMMRNSRKLKDELSQANEEIVRLSQIEERQRISRDLHDTLGHTLSLITLKSELAGKLLSKNPERAAAEIKDIEATSRSALQQVRDLVTGMSALSVKDEVASARQILRTAGIQFVLEGNADSLEVTPIIQNILGYCLREAINNVVKHSGALKCRVSLEENPQELRMTISDDGNGTALPRSGVQSSGRGLLGMQERLDFVQGKLQFSSPPGQGSVLTITIPKVIKHSS